MRRKTYKRFLVLPSNFYQIQSSLVWKWLVWHQKSRSWSISHFGKLTWHVKHESRVTDSSNEIARLRKHDVFQYICILKAYCHGTIIGYWSFNAENRLCEWLDFYLHALKHYFRSSYLLIIVVSLTKMGVRGYLYESFLLLALSSSAVHGGKSSCAFQNKHFVYS